MSETDGARGPGELRVDIEHDDVDPPEPDAPTTGIYVSLLPPDGMRFSGSIYVDGEATPEQVAEMLRRATVAVAAAHSPQLLHAVRGPEY